MNDELLNYVLNEMSFYLDIDKAKEIKLKLFKESFEHHYNNCPEYRRYCQMQGVTPEDIQNYEDLVKIQPVPSDAFRDSEKLIISIPESEIRSILTTSSTTSPKPVRFALDKTSFERMVKINSFLWQTGHEMNLSNLGSMIFMAPRPSESDTGLVKGGWLSFKDMGYKDEDIFFAIKENRVDTEGLIRSMRIAKKPLNMYGPPFAYLPLIEALKGKGEKFMGNDSRILTTGGWKGVAHNISKDELRQQLSETFGIPQEHIRDGYGSTDIMTMLPECRFHKKHLPIWNHVSIRDPEDTSRELPPGQEGLVVLMAAWIRSYPAYCMTGDMGYFNEGKCECGRIGQTVEITGRAKGAGSRGCAIRLEQFMAVIGKKS